MVDGRELIVDGFLIGASLPHLLLSRQSCPQSFQAFLWPDLFGIVVVLKSGCSFGKLKPGHFSPRVNVDIRWKKTWVVQGSNANESDLPAVTVVTPEGSLAVAASINVVRPIRTGHRNRFHVAARYLYRRTLDDGIENKCAARVPLAIRAMAAVHTHRLSQKLVAHLATGTAALRFLAFRLGSLFRALHFPRTSSYSANSPLQER